MSHPLIRSGQWSQTTTGTTQHAARLSRLVRFVMPFVELFVSSSRAKIAESFPFKSFGFECDKQRF